MAELGGRIQPVKLQHEIDPTALSDARQLTTRVTDAIERLRLTLTRLRCAGAVRLFGREIVSWDAKITEG